MSTAGIRLALPVSVGLSLGLSLGLSPTGPDPLLAQVPSAQDTLRGERADTIPVYRTDEIAVSVTRSTALLARLPFALSVLGRDLLQGPRRTVSLDESLRYTPGVFVGNRRNFAVGDRLTLRGVGARAQFGVRGVRVLADGIPLTLPDGQSTLTNLDLASAGRVEVIHGPAAALYGNSAGGVVSVETEQPGEERRVAPAVFAGAYGFVQARLKATGRIGGLGYVASGTYLNTEGFRNHADARVARGNLALSHAVGEGRLRGIFSLYHTPFARSPSSLDEETARAAPRSVRSSIVQQGVGERATQAQGGLSLDLPLAPAHRLRSAGWVAWRQLWNAIPGRIIQLDRVAGGARAAWQGEVGRSHDREATGDAAAGLTLHWLGGVDIEVQRDQRVERENLGIPAPEERPIAGTRLLDQREAVLGVGPFLKLELQLGTRWRLGATGRVDTYRFDVDDRFLEDGDDGDARTFTEFSPSVGLTFAATANLHLYGNLSTAFQTPTASELSNRPDGRGGFNPDLRPERLRSVELGLRGSLSGPRLGYTLGFFHSRVRDALVPFEGPSEETFFRNAGEVERLGVEVGLGWSPLPGLVTRLAYTRQRLRFEDFVTPDGDFTGNAEPGVPDQWLTVGLRHKASFGLVSELDLRWVDAYPVNDANDALNWSYGVVDLRLAFDRTDTGVPVRVFVGVDNLFDERYNASVVPNAFGRRYYEPAPGVELLGGLELPIGA
jgi:iron complex outermembrane receptor protein